MTSRKFPQKTSIRSVVEETMGLPKFTIYKYVRTSKGRRYCRPVVAKNRKIKPDMVIVGGSGLSGKNPCFKKRLDTQVEVANISSDFFLHVLQNGPDCREARSWLLPGFLVVGDEPSGGKGLADCVTEE